MAGGGRVDGGWMDRDVDHDICRKGGAADGLLGGSAGGQHRGPGLWPGGTLAGLRASDGGMRVWQVPDGQELLQLEGHTDAVWAIQRSPDGRMRISGSLDGTVRIWTLP